MPGRTVNPGWVSHSWYPSLDSTSLGIGATGDYWLSGLAARDRSFGKIATIDAIDQALPDSRVTDQRSGPTVVTQPIPGTETRLSWQLGPRAAAVKHLTLTLTDVSALTLDAAAAKLRLGTITLRSDVSTRFTISHLQRGTE